MGPKTNYRMPQLQVSSETLIRMKKIVGINHVHELADKFPQESGYRWRQFKRFNNLLTLYTLCYKTQRPYCELERKIPIPTLTDLQWAIDMAKDVEFVPPHKMKWFRDVFRKAFTDKSQEVNFGSESSPLLRDVITGNDIVNYMKKSQLGNQNVKQIRETFLKTLFDHGMIEKDQDPRNRSRDAYWPSEDSSNSKSSLISISSFNESCVRSFIDKINLQRFSFGVKDNKITLDELVKIVIESPKIEPKIANDEMAVSDDVYSTETNLEKFTT